ncbi:unnamed protein product [Rotaria sordida]|uniref:MIF4G domain-containing protein n=1 Tax=Rotaria sordida TaxID=392033 RepID=A0A814U6C8_9BILA|nr:unnamed protein product [Rotaria sordida]
MGKLFKLRMLRSSYVYKTTAYLFRNKTDEEHLECLWSLLCMIGQNLDVESAEKPKYKLWLNRYYSDLDTIIKERKTSARICRMIQDLIELRQIGSNLEQKQDNIDSAFSGSSQQQYNDECDNCSSEMEQKPNRNENEVDNSFNVDILTQLHSVIEKPVLTHSNDKEYQELLAINLADQHLWKKRIFH